METAKTLVAPEVEQRLPWHRPVLERLVITFDTQEGQGSDVDCEFHNSLTHDDICA